MARATAASLVAATLLVAALFFSPSLTAAPEVAPPEPPPASASVPAARTYGLDMEHTTVGFRVGHLGIVMIEGEFGEVEGTVVFTPADLARTRVSATIQTASVDTDVDARDAHLRTADFFDVEAYPTMTFQSTAVHPTGPDTFRLRGDLTLHGVTRPVDLDVTATGPFSFAHVDRAGFHAEGEIDRRDFGMTWGEILPGGVPDIGHLVTLVLDVEVKAG